MRTRGMKWDLFLEYLLEALAVGVVAAAGWVAKRIYRRYENARKKAKKAKKDVDDEA